MQNTAITTAADGTTLFYRTWGTQTQGPRLALVHSLAMDGAFWDRVAKELQDEMQILALDCRGHGKSGKARGPYDVGLFADDLAAVLNHAGWPDSVVAGASMGGCVALSFAQKYPMRTKALGLIDTTSYYGADAPAAWEDRAQKALQGGMAALIGFQKSRWFSEAFQTNHPDIVETAVEVFLSNDLDCYADTCRMLGQCDLRAGMAQMICPTEVVVGEEDYATPVGMAEEMARTIAGANLTVLPSVRHFTPLETPTVIAQHLRVLAQRA